MKVKSRMMACPNSERDKKVKVKSRMMTCPPRSGVSLSTAETKGEEKTELVASGQTNTVTAS